MSFLPMAATLNFSPPLITLRRLHFLPPQNFHHPFNTTTSTARIPLLASFSADESQHGSSENPPKSARKGRKKKKDADPTDHSSKKTTTTTTTTTTRSTKRPKEKEQVAPSEAGPKPPRRGRKKKDVDVGDGGGGASSTSAKTKTTRSKKSPREDETDEEFDDGMDFPYEYPPLVCCFGAVHREFVPTVRQSRRQMHPDKYSTWKTLQWNPPEFARAPGGSPANVAIAHVRLGGRAAFMGKVGDDDYGNELVLMLNEERVQTRAVKIDPGVKTAISHMRFEFRDDRKMVAETSQNCAEDSFSQTNLDLAVLKEARIFHYNSKVLLSDSMHPALFKAIKFSKKYCGNVFLDLNLPLPLWESRQQTWELIQKAWKQSDLIRVSRQELEFLLDEDYYERKRNYKPQYYAESFEQTKNRRNYYHYTKEEIQPLWHDSLKILFVTDGTLRIHYYTQEFDGVVVGTEDVLITPFTCDRTGSGDAVVAGIMRKLTIHPEMYSDQESLERNLRFAIAAGIISQWTIGAVRSFPTESATQNLKEQVYVPSMW